MFSRRPLWFAAGLVGIFFLAAPFVGYPTQSEGASCQKYHETATRAALEADGQLSVASKQAWALESIAWSLVYQSCKGK